MGSTMKAAVLFVALALAVTGIWAVTEVQELGNDDSTSGSSVSLDADDSAEYDDMGEGFGGRRGAFLSTSGSFTLSSGGSNRSGTGGEEDEYEFLAAQATGTLCLRCWSRYTSTAIAS